MNPTLAKIIFILFVLIAIPASIYPFLEAGEALTALSKNENEIYFDTGVFYLFLMSSMIVMGCMEMLARVSATEGKQTSPLIINLGEVTKKYASKILIGWFLFTLVVANVAPIYVNYELENAGYQSCHDPREISRVSPGKSLIYLKGKNCEHIN